MKTILTLCIGFLIPHFIFSQNQVSNPFLHNQVKEPDYFKESNKEPNKNILKLHKSISKFKPLYLNQPDAVVLPVKQSLDSIISIPVDTSLSNRKTEYTYNTNGKLTSSAQYNWNKSTQSWENIAKGEWSYDAKGNNITYITYFGDLQDWYNELKFEYIYDNNKLIRTDGYGWDDGITQWVIGSKTEFTYNPEGLLSQEINYEWDAGNSIWNQTTKKEYSYNTSNQLDSLTSYEWQSQWNYKDLRTFNYYVFDNRERFSYYFTWDGSGQWANFSYTEIQYDIDRKLNFFYEYKWDVLSVTYVYSFRIEYRYDVNDNMNQAILSKWSRNIFVLDSKEDMVYDLQHSRNELLLPPNLNFSLLTDHYYDNEIYFNYKLDKFSLSLHNGVNYIPESHKNFYYSPINITKTKESLNNALQLIPNPANNFIIITGDRISEPMNIVVFDINGKPVISKKVFNNQLISTESLAKGIYFYKIHSSNYIKSGKLVLN